jgi:putative phosphoesterase
LDSKDSEAARHAMTEILGIISDTHGLLRPEAVDALKGCSRIIHAGDVGSPDILDRLRDIAPTVAVRGNVDHGAWAAKLPMTRIVEFGGFRIYVRHIVDDIDIVPADEGVSAVVYGHSHKPSLARRDGVLYLNPGAAGPRRFNLPVTVAKLWVEDGALAAAIEELKVR